MADLEIEFLYIDLSSCERCLASDANLREALAVVKPALDALGITTNSVSTLVESEQQARVLGLASSPTIRINGTDIAAGLDETACAECGELCGRSDMTCRAWTFRGMVFDQPPVGLIVEALLRAVLHGDSPRPAQGPSPSLQSFFRDHG